jgi:hypothetical protein
MKTVQDILKESGLTDEQIAQIDAKATEGFTKILSTASQEREQAELAKRAVEQKYDTEIAPALDNWANEKTQKDAEIAFYKTQFEGAKAAGFISADAPGKPVVRDSGGKFVAGANEVPGSPAIVAKLTKDVGGAVGSILDLNWKYQSLFGKPMPDSPTTLIREAEAQRMDPIAYAAKKYDFAAKEAAMKAEEQKKHDDAITAAAIAENDKKWAEKVGNNPNIRQAEVSRFSVLDKAVKDGERPDPLKMTREERHSATRQAINKEMASNTVN